MSLTVIFLLIAFGFIALTILAISLNLGKKQEEARVTYALAFIMPLCAAVALGFATWSNDHNMQVSHDNWARACAEQGGVVISGNICIKQGFEEIHVR